MHERPRVPVAQTSGDAHATPGSLLASRNPSGALASPGVDAAYELTQDPRAPSTTQPHH
jgi:hypothetical protein